MSFGIIGSGSWATALAKILTDNKVPINWWIRSQAVIDHLRLRHHNSHYLHSVYFDTGLLTMSKEVSKVVADSDYLVIAVPSAFVEATLEKLPKNAFRGKKIISAVKGILPEQNLLLNEYLVRK